MEIQEQNQNLFNYYMSLSIKNSIKIPKIYYQLRSSLFPSRITSIGLLGSSIIFEK